MRTRSARPRPRGGSPPLRRAKTISSPGTRTRSSPPPPPRTGSRRSRPVFRTPPSSPAPPTSASGSPSSFASFPRIVHTGRVASLHEIREEDDRVEIGARGDLRGGRAGTPRPRPGHRRDAAPSRVEAGARGRHRRRQHRQRLPDRGLPARSHRPRRHHRAPPPRHEADPPARGLLPRLRPPGPGAGRDPDPHRRAAARPGGALPVLQGLEALRSGHLPPSSAPSAFASNGAAWPRRASLTGAWPRRRSAPGTPSAPPPVFASTSPRPGRPPPTPSPTTSLRSTTTGRAPPTE